jgi:hypothetical protein
LIVPGKAENGSWIPVERAGPSAIVGPSNRV